MPRQSFSRAIRFLLGNLQTQSLLAQNVQVCSQVSSLLLWSLLLC